MVGDANLPGQMRPGISRLQKRLGITTVYVTHDQTGAMTLGHRVAVMKRSTLPPLASRRELLQNPGNRFVAGSIGFPPVNFVPAAAVDRTSVKLPFGAVQIPQGSQRQGVAYRRHPAEHFEDARVVDKDATGPTFLAKVEVVEWLAYEAYAYIPFVAPPEVQAQFPQLEQDLDGESTRTRLVVWLDGASRIAEGDEVEIYVDATKMHLFDPMRGEYLRSICPTPAASTVARPRRRPRPA